MWTIAAGRLLAAVVAVTAIAAPPEVPRFLSGMSPAVPPTVVGWGDVRLEVAVSAGGTVSAMRTLRTTPPFTELLRSSVAAWRFEPVRTVMGPVAAHVLVVGIFRPRTLYDTPALGVPPVDVARPSPHVPEPLEIPAPVYPVHAIGDGVVIVETLVNADGAVSPPRVVVSAGAAFDASALDAASAALFRPARVDGVAMPGRAYLVFGFRSPVIGGS